MSPLISLKEPNIRFETPRAHSAEYHQRQAAEGYVDAGEPAPALCGAAQVFRQGLHPFRVSARPGLSALVVREAARVVFPRAVCVFFGAFLAEEPVSLTPRAAARGTSFGVSGTAAPVSHS